MDTPMPFELFQNPGKSFSPRISVRKNGQLGVNQAALNTFNIHTGYVQLFYDKKLFKIGIKINQTEESQGALKIRYRTTGADIAAKSFFDYFRIRHKETLSKECKLESDIIVIRLAKIKA